MLMMMMMMMMITFTQRSVRVRYFVHAQAVTIGWHRKDQAVIYCLLQYTEATVGFSDVRCSLTSDQLMLVDVPRHQ